MFNQYTGDGFRFEIGCPQRTIHPMKLPKLEITNRSNAKILVEGCPKCSLGHVGRGGQFLYVNELAVTLL